MASRTPMLRCPRQQPKIGPLHFIRARYVVPPYAELTYGTEAILSSLSAFMIWTI